jgi:C-terminal processing protease CtpA/Prc
MTTRAFNQEVREQVFTKVVETVAGKLYDPALNGVDWNRIADERRNTIVMSDTPADFEARMNELIRELHVSHAGFFSEERPRAAAKIAIGATFHADGGQWIFQDVHAGGPAHAAGMQPGDTLLAVAGKASLPPEMPSFALGESVEVDIERRNHARECVHIHIPVSKKKEHPIVKLDPPSWKRMQDGTGYLKIAMFPGIVGIDLAHDIDRAIHELSCDRLIVDLRGNAGGGMGSLRVMSYLTPGGLPVGYSVTRKDLDRPDFDKARLPRFNRIPDWKIGLIPLLFRFAIRGRSVAVFTERKGPQRFHGNVVLLVNEHTASSSEMVTAFAAENGLATVVGARTAGRLLGSDSFGVGHGYRLAIPVVEYRTWRETRLEGKGVEPHVPVPFDPDALRNGVDEQLNAAVAALSGKANYRMATG